MQSGISGPGAQFVVVAFSRGSAFDFDFALDFAFVFCFLFLLPNLTFALAFDKPIFNISFIGVSTCTRHVRGEGVIYLNQSGLSTSRRL